MTIALIDADLIAFRASAGVAQTFNWGDGDGASIAGNPEGAREAALQTVEAWRKLAGCKDVLCAFTGSGNFRKTVLPTYKAARKGKGKPVDYHYVVQCIEETYPSMTINGLEADDILGILATTDRFVGNAVVVSQDKDLATIPCDLLSPGKDTKPRRITKADADHFWLLQTLMGDPTDGYTGIPGMGPKGAFKMLGVILERATLDTLWRRVLAAYHKAGLTEADALQQARVARILRRADYDKATKEVILWHPLTPVRLALGSLSPASPTASTPPKASP